MHAFISKVDINWNNKRAMTFFSSYVRYMFGEKFISSFAICINNQNFR